MYTAPSDRFLQTLTESHVPYTAVELHRADGIVQLLPHTDGSVTVDRGQSVRRTCTVTVPDTSLIPLHPSDQLAIYGARLRILRGISYPDGTTESVPLGFFRIDSVGGDPDIGPVTITGSGLEAVLADDPFITPYTTRGGTSAITAITGLIQDSIPGAIVVSRVGDATLGTTTWDVQGDRWQAITDCATALGAEVYADADGQFVIAQLPDIATAAIAWTVDEGDGGVLISASRAYARTGMYNVVVASGQNAEDNVAAVSATVSDTDPTSPTYVGGSFGRKPRFYSSSLLVTQPQATAAATKVLADAVLPVATVSIEALPNPLLEPGDVMRVTYASGERELHQIQSLTLDLGLGSTTIATIGGKQDA